MDTEKVLLWGGAAVAAYFIYEYYISPTATATLPAGVPTTGIPTGWVGSSGQAGSATAPHAGDTWINAENQVVAQFNGTTWVPSTAAVATPAAVPVPVTPAAAALSLAAIYSQLLAKITAANDPAISNLSATPDVFNYYLAEILGTAAPDPIAVFGGRPVMTLATYWAGMGPYLTANFGMSGLTARGLGYLAQQYRRGYMLNGELVLR
jgi:hypothetical protein